MRTAMMAITTSSSMRVNARERKRRMKGGSKTGHINDLRRISAKSSIESPDVPRSTIGTMTNLKGSVGEAGFACQPSSRSSGGGRRECTLAEGRLDSHLNGGSSSFANGPH